MNYTLQELQMLSEMYNLSVEELKELFDQGYTEEDLDSMYSPDEREDESSMEEQEGMEEPEEEEVIEAKMGLSLADLVTKSVQDYTSKKYDVGGNVEGDCPPGYRRVGQFCEIIDEEGQLRAANIPRQLYDIDTKNNQAYLGPKETRQLGYSPFVSAESMYNLIEDGIENSNNDQSSAYRKMSYNVGDYSRLANVATNPVGPNEPYYEWNDRTNGFDYGVRLGYNGSVEGNTFDNYLSNLALPEQFSASQAYKYKENDWEGWNDSLKKREEYLQNYKTPSTTPTAISNTTPEPTLSRRELRQQRIDNQMEPIESRTAPRLSTDLSNSPPRDYNLTLPENNGMYSSNREPADNNISAPKGYYYSTTFQKYIPEDADQVALALRRYLDTPENEKTGFDENEYDINYAYFNRYRSVTPEQFAAGDLSNEEPLANPNSFQPLYINDDPKQGEYKAFYDPNNITSVKTPLPTQTVTAPTPTSAPVVQTPATPSTTLAPAAPPTPAVTTPITPIVPTPASTPIPTSTPQAAVPASTPAPVASTSTSPAPSTPTQPNYTLGPLNTDPTPGSFVPYATQNDESNALYAKEADQRMAALNQEMPAEEMGNSFKDKALGVLKKGAQFLGGPGGQGMLMGLGNMAVDAASANAMNQQLAALKQARVFNINPDFFSGANPGIASGNNYDMSAAIYADAGAAVQTQNVGKSGNVPIEAEGGEFYFDPNSMATIPISGPKHEQGGVPFNAEDGAFIFSDSQKISGKMVNEIIGSDKLKDKKQYTISDVIRTLPDFFDTKKEAEELTKTTNDKIRNTSLKRNIEKKANNLAMLLAHQQKNNGNHGEEVGQEQMNNEVPMADPGIAVTENTTTQPAAPTFKTTNTLEKNKKGQFVVNGKVVTKEAAQEALKRATKEESAQHARDVMEAAKSGDKYYIPEKGPWAGIPIDISKEAMTGPKSRQAQGVKELFSPYGSVDDATKAAADFTANPQGKRQYRTEGAPSWFVGGITPKLVEDKFGGREALLKQLNLDPKNYGADIWNDPKFKTDFTKAFETKYVPQAKWRPVLGDDHVFGLDYYDFYKEPEKSTSTFTEEKKKEEEQKKTIPTPPEENVPGKLYEESLTPYDYGRYFSDVATIVPEEYLQQVTPRYKPLNLLTAREQINEAARTAAAASLSGTGVESVDAARQAAVAASLAGQAGKATENVQNLNRGIVDEYFQYNNAQFLNAQQANERAKADFVQRSMQNQQAAQETRRQAQEDFAEKSRDVSQFNTGLRFAENIYSPQYSTFVGEDGKIPIVGRDGTEYRFSPSQLIFGNLPSYATSQVETKSSKKKKEEGNRKGGKVKSKSRKLIK